MVDDGLQKIAVAVKTVIIPGGDCV